MEGKEREEGGRSESNKMERGGNESGETYGLRERQREEEEEAKRGGKKWERRRERQIERTG